MPISASAAPPVYLVSDIDDTVKISDVHDYPREVRYALASEASFAGMADLYRAILGDHSAPERLIFLSGSPFVLQHKTREFLRDNRFPDYRLTLRGIRELRTPAFRYKNGHIDGIVPDAARFILVGDDTECDPEVYEAFAASARHEVLAIYVHRIDGRALATDDPRIVPFVTAFDIAMREYVAGRLSEAQAAQVGDAVLRGDDANFLPRFQQCPVGARAVEGLPDALAALEAKIADRITALCLAQPRVRVHPERSGCRG